MIDLEPMQEAKIKYNYLHAVSLFCTAFVLSVVPIIPVFLYELQSTYMHFPPRELYTEKKPFSYFAFIFIFIFSLPFLKFIYAQIRSLELNKIKAKSFPFWGYLSFILIFTFWFLAWTRYPFFEKWQIHTFPMLWASYILIANAFLYMKRGKTLFYSGYYMSFLLSVSYWWLFEFLNRFVQNWYYQGIILLNAEEYFRFASLSFATLLPSVWVTKELVESFFVLPNEDSHKSYHLNPKKTFYLAFFGLFSAVLILYHLRNFPSELFPMVWLAPVFLYAAFSALFLYSKTGIYLNKLFILKACFWCLASLICGFFWEMWNYYSLAKWIYHISYVDALRLFEMPLLGYLGYLPFGLCCWIPVAFIEFSFERKAEKN